jgi:hypothetical protein
VRLVADDEIPPRVRVRHLGLQVLVSGELVEPGDHEVRLGEPVSAGRLQLVVGQDLEGQMEPPRQLVLPLLGEAARADDEAALEVAPGDQLLHQEAGHDRLPGARVVGQQEAQGLAGEHHFVDGRDLVRQGLDQGRVDGQDRVEEMGQPDAVSFGDQPEQRPVAVEAPGTTGRGNL